MVAPCATSSQSENTQRGTRDFLRCRAASKGTSLDFFVRVRSAGAAAAAITRLTRFFRRPVAAFGTAILLADIPVALLFTARAGTALTFLRTTLARAPALLAALTTLIVPALAALTLTALTALTALAALTVFFVICHVSSLLRSSNASLTS